MVLNYYERYEDLNLVFKLRRFYLFSERKNGINNKSIPIFFCTEKINLIGQIDLIILSIVI